MTDPAGRSLERRCRAEGDETTLEALLQHYRRSQQDPPWDALAASQRWRRVVSFCRKWLAQPLSDADSSPPRKIHRGELSVELKLPWVLREWYLLLGERKDILTGQIMPPRLTTLETMEGDEDDLLLLSRIAFRHDDDDSRDSFPFWGVRVGDVGLPDPPVVRLLDNGRELNGDHAGFTLSEYFLSALITELTTSPGLYCADERLFRDGARGGSGRERRPRAQALAALEQHYHPPPIPRLSADLFGDADTVLALEEGGQARLPKGRMVYVIARTPAAWRRAVEVLAKVELKSTFARPTTYDVGELVDGLRDHYGEHAPRALGAGTNTEADLAALEADLGTALTPEHRHVLLEAGPNLTLGHGHRLLDADGVRAAQQRMQARAASGDFAGRNVGETLSIWNARRIALQWAHPRWIPFAESADYGLLCVDLAPASKGVEGQVLGWRDGPFVTHFDSLVEYLGRTLDHYQIHRPRINADGTLTPPMHYGLLYKE